MDTPHAKHHIHSPSWDNGKKSMNNTTSSNTHSSHSHQHSATDSFFNRVFGHHSSESSRGKHSKGLKGTRGGGKTISELLLLLLL